MTAGTARRSPVVGTAPLGKGSRWALALLMPIGPAAVGVLRYILPYYNADTAPDIATAATAHPGAQSAVLWLGYLAVLTLVPGFLAAAALTRATSPRLTLWSIGLVVPAYLSMGALLATDQLLWSGSQAGLSPETVASMLDTPHPTMLISVGIFVLGHVIGTVLLGVAFLRTRCIPVWAAWAIVVSQPLHFVATVILGSPTLDLIAWSATALGMAMAARALLQEAPGQH